MSGAQTSTFGNVLFNAPAAYEAATAYQHNQLLNTEAQQTIASNDMEQVGRAASWIDTLPADQKPQAYQAARTQLQAAGFAKNAPAEYPGDQAITMLARQSLPVADQYKLGIVTPPGTTAAINAALGGGNQPAQGGQPPAQGSVPPGTGVTIGQRQNNPGNLSYAGQPGASPGQGNRFASFPDMPTGVAANADQLALYQTQHGINTVRGAVTRWVGDPKADLTGSGAGGTDVKPGSYIGDVAKALGVGPDDKIDLTDPAVQAKFIQAQFPHESAGGGYVLNPADVAKGVQMSAANRGQRVQAPGTTVATTPPPAAPPGSAPAPGTYQVASNAPVAPPGSAAPATAAPVVAQGSQPPAPAPAAPAQPTGPQANLPHASEVPTGPSSPQYQQAMDLQRRAMILDAQPDPTGRLKTLAAGLRSQAALILQSDSVVSTQEGQLHTMTGKIDDPAKPLPHYVYDQTQHAYIDTTGTNKPEFQPAQRDTAVAQRDVMELGPKVANGTATPEEVAQYNVAATTYQQPTLKENPVTKETVRVNTRELPPGFPQPSGAGGAGGSNVVMPGLGTAQQEIERNPAAYKVAESQYERDSKEIGAIGDAGRSAQADQIRIKEMQDVLQRFSSGAGTEARTAASAWLQRWLPSGITGWEKESPNLSGADAAQAFQKLALTGAGSQERSVLGNRGGFQAIRMFQAANPNVNLQDATNKSILDMQLISNQANQDYSQAALSHFADNETKFAQTHQYASLAQFDRQWNAQRSPQVYAAAMGAISGQQPEQWAKGLSDAEYARALKVVENAKPGAVVNGKSGRIVVQPPTATPPPGFTVVPQ